MIKDDEAHPFPVMTKNCIDRWMDIYAPMMPSFGSCAIRHKGESVCVW
jgi:hypothetical protein